MTMWVELDLEVMVYEYHTIFDDIFLGGKKNLWLCQNSHLNMAIFMVDSPIINGDFPS